MGENSDKHVNDFLDEYRNELRRIEKEGFDAPNSLADIDREAQRNLSASDYAFYGQNKNRQIEDYERGEQLFQSARLILKTGVSTVASAVGLGAVAGVIGWVYTKSYFSTFSAEWILTSVSFLHYLTNSVFPLGIVIVLSWFTLSYMYEKREGEQRIESAWLLSGGIFILGLISLVFVAIAADYFWSIKLTPLFQFAWFLFGPFVFCISFGMLVRHTRYGDAGWNRNTASCLACLVLGIYLIAQFLGEANGKSDMNPRSSKLPMVKVKDGGGSLTSFRLLHSEGSRVYLVKLDDIQDSPKVVVREANELTEIRGVK